MKSHITRTFWREARYPHGLLGLLNDLSNHKAENVHAGEQTPQSEN